MHVDIADFIWHCSVYQQDRPLTPPKEKLSWTDKGGAPFIGWSINMVGPFLRDKDRNCYLLVTVDPSLK